MAKFLQLYASMHAHSTHSDGIYTPEELAEVGFREGYKALVLTDHDTVSGTGEMITACQNRGIECMMGIEFSAPSSEFQTHFHITAFHFDANHPDMKEYLDKMSYKETEETRILFERGREIGYIQNISWDEVLEFNKGITWLCNEHVFRAMKSKGLITDLAYRDFFLTCYGVHRGTVGPDVKFLDVNDIISLVHSAGGIACVAHPKHPYGSLDGAIGLVKHGIDGIEVWHSLLTGAERKRALEIAKEYDLFVSGGADHEGLLGGQYIRYAEPKKTKYYFPPLTLGTTKYFFEELRDCKKYPDRQAVMDALLSDGELWITNGGIDDLPFESN